jgi:hypothetical protein
MPLKHIIPDNDLNNKTIRCLQEEYNLGDEISFMIRDKDKEKTGRQYLSEFRAKGVKISDFTIKSDNIDSRCCPDCKRTSEEDGVDFYKKGRSGIVYCKDCWRIRS